MKAKMISKTTAFFIWLGIGITLMIMGAIILRHYSSGYSNPESIAILLLVLSSCFGGVAIHQSDEVHRDNQKRLQEIKGNGDRHVEERTKLTTQPCYKGIYQQYLDERKERQAKDVQRQEKQS